MADAEPKMAEKIANSCPEADVGNCGRTYFMWSAPFFRQASNLLRQGVGLELSSLPRIPKWEEPLVNKIKLENEWAREMKKQRPSLFRTMMRFMGFTQLNALLFMQIYSILQIGCALLVNFVVKSIETIRENPEDDSGIVTGYLITVAIGVCNMLSAYIQQWSWHLSSRQARRFWVALSAVIFEKPAYLSSSARAGLSEGDLVNMIQQDAQQVVTMLQFVVLTSMWPGFLLVACTCLFVFLGWPFVVGLIVNLGNAWGCERVADLNKKYFQQKMKIADERQRKLNETFQGIKAIKFAAWEAEMAQRVEDIRKRELAILWKIHFLQSIQQSLSFGMPVLGTVGTFLLYEANGGELDASRIFVCVGLFELLTNAISMLPHFFTMSRMIFVNLGRIQKLLMRTNDLSYTAVDAATAAGKVIVENASFAWDKEKGNTLSSITLSAEPGQLVTICGRVGSGKSTLAASMLKLVDCTEGTVAIGGARSYVPQSAQILNDTVKNNILFGTDFEEERYNRVIEACALEDDLAQLVNGDDTEIGEKGVTISGGQKQRVSIARAAYARSDVIILDDPLSAMDAHVGKIVFDKCLCGLMADRTRIFFTNQLQFCTDSNCVYMLEDLRLVESGTYAELAAAGGAFAQLNAALVGQHSADQESTVKYTMTEKDANPKSEKDADPRSAEKSEDDVKDKEEAPAGVVKRASVTRRASMTKEIKQIGHVGFKDFLVLARSANSFIVGLILIITCAATPVLKYGVTVALAEWSESLSPLSGKTESEQQTYLVVYLLTTAVFIGGLLTRGVVFIVYFLRSSRELHKGMLNSVMRQRMVWFDSTPIGRILNRFGFDTMNMDQLLPMFSQYWSLQAGTVVVTVFLSAVFVPPSLVLSLAVLIFFTLLYRRYGEVAVDLQRLNMMSIGPLTGAFSGFLGTLDTIRAFGRVQLFVDRFGVFQTNFIKSLYWQFTLDRTVQFLLLSPLVSVFVMVVSFLMLALVQSDGMGDLITPARAGLIIALSNTLAFQFPMVVMITARLEQAIVATQRVNEYKVMDWEPGSIVEKKTRRPSKENQAWVHHGELKICDVSMRYADDLPLVLDGVTIEAKPAQKLAIVGRTGSGKSSLILVVFRMVQLEGGSVLIDSTDTSGMTLRALRGNLGIIPQDCWMFSGTIRDNLDVNGSFTSEQLWDALKLVQLDDQIKGFEKGLDHEVQEKGENMSMGTRQLLCLARVLLKKPKLIFMDEATASVDVKTDMLVQQTIRTSFTESTIVTIAHRLNTIIDFDRIAVMDLGKLVEYGSPESLLENEDGHFTRLVRNSGNEKELRQRALNKDGAFMETETI